MRKAKVKVDSGTTPKILFEDDWTLIVDKPSGLLVHRGAGTQKEPALLQQLRDFVGYHVYPIHRLDRGTSGPVVFAKSSEAAAALQATFQSDQTQKLYLALVHGIILEPQILDRPLTDEDGTARPAQTELWPLEALHCEEGRPYTLIKARIRTGRQNQIRRHLSGIAKHIIGDVNFGKARLNQPIRDKFKVDRLMLHCGKIGFTSIQQPPAWIEIQSSVPSDFLAVIAGLNFNFVKSLAENHGKLPQTFHSEDA
jgi:tRNA pseudouridine65 synthase